MKNFGRTLSFLIALLTLTSSLVADPCGMVPPIWTGNGPAITRVGEQMTYAFFKDGVETFVIRPGFSGRVDNFGMLIPFPSAPAIRKVPDEIFQHVAAAVDPPEAYLYLGDTFMLRAARSGALEAESAENLRFDDVRVIRQEAVGMYDVAVLEAGSPAALGRWMSRNGYVYPQGMDTAVGSYVEMGWTFVAVKTRVGSSPAVQPRPGMREVDPSLPAGATFDGAVQAMGFRFRVREPVIPMRLSTFNDGELRNVVYFLSERPVRFAGLAEGLVRRQVAGDVLRQNTEILPVRVLGGDADDVGQKQLDALEAQRNPDPHNGRARELFASDLLAVERGELALAFEEKEKVLLRISEALDLRGAAVDQLHASALAEARQESLEGALKSLDGMTLTVFDGDFPRQHLRDHNLRFNGYEMPEERNNIVAYHAVTKGPGSDPGGFLIRGRVVPESSEPWWKRLW